VLSRSEYKKNHTTFVRIRQAAAPFAISGNGKESLNPILDPDVDPDYHKNLITSKLDRV